MKARVDRSKSGQSESDRWKTIATTKWSRHEKEKYVNDLFKKIARRYDLLNRIISLGRDVAWRRHAVKLARVGAGMWAIDVATGTGDFAIELARRVGHGGRVVGVDFCTEMLEYGRRKIEKSPVKGANIELVEGNALNLQFPDNTFDVATMGFALRNVADIRRAISEMTRVVKPGGRVVCLEVARPRMPGFKQLFNLYFYWLVPLIGRLARREGAYTYLPHSIVNLPDLEELAAIMEECGLGEVKFYPLTFGVSAIHMGVKPM